MKNVIASIATVATLGGVAWFIYSLITVDGFANKVFGAIVLAGVCIILVMVIGLVFQFWQELLGN